MAVEGQERAVRPRSQESSGSYTRRRRVTVSVSACAMPEGRNAHEAAAKCDRMRTRGIHARRGSTKSRVGILGTVQYGVVLALRGPVLCSERRSGSGPLFSRGCIGKSSFHEHWSTRISAFGNFRPMGICALRVEGHPRSSNNDKTPRVMLRTEGWRAHVPATKSYAQ